MAKKIDAMIAEILKQYGLGTDALWDCHGTLVLLHKYCEQIAAKAGITFDAPTIIEASSREKTVAILATGRMGDRSEWSIGEAAPSNNKNSYPYAMAEKRAKDRVILKLIGLSGFVYSEEESDDFKRQPDTDPIADKINSAASLTALRDVWGSLTKDQHAKYVGIKDARKDALEAA